MLKKTLLLILTVCAFYGVQRFCAKQTAGFQVGKIVSQLAPDCRWECPITPTEELAIKQILSQPFTYLGKGAQCYVFASQDGKHVIKFFRMSHIDTPRWLKEMPLPAKFEPWRLEKIVTKQSKREKDFFSYKCAYETLKEETGLLYLHLNKTSHLNQTITIVDRLGIEHALDLDQMEFMVQKRAAPFYAAIEEMLQKKEMEKAKAAISNLVQMLVKRHNAGLSDKDPDLRTNFGLVDVEPIQFDIGRFKDARKSQKNEPFQNELIRITDQFKHWLEKREPALAEHLEGEIEGI